MLCAQHTSNVWRARHIVAHTFRRLVVNAYALNVAQPLLSPLASGARRTTGPHAAGAEPFSSCTPNVIAPDHPLTRHDLSPALTGLF